jgi:hypothetical protein
MSGIAAAPTGVDVKIPSPARIYDYYLGGKDNFAADRVAAEKALSVVPEGREVARSNRQFLVRAVRHMASQGVAQFIDLGTSFPTSPSVHQIAAANVAVRPRVVYIDNDPMVTSHNQALLAGNQVATITVLHGDIRSPARSSPGMSSGTRSTSASLSGCCSSPFYTSSLPRMIPTAACARSVRRWRRAVS